MATQLKFCRINLVKTNYNIINYPYAREITIDQRMQHWDQVQHIYTSYCRHKKFDSVMPLWISQFQSSEYKLIGYFDNNHLVAWTKLRLLDRCNIESEQFAWDYKKPNLKLGIKSLEFESAYFKLMGFTYIWLGFDDHYKRQIEGFEIAGNT